MRKLSDLYSRRSGPWFARTDQLLEHVLRTQSTAAARNIPLVPFFRFLSDKSAYSEIHREAQTTEKLFADPVASHIYVDNGPKSKPLEKYSVDVRQDHNIAVDLAECIRLGETFGTIDKDFDFHFYLPKAGDVYQWDNSLFRIRELKPENYYVLLQRYIVWKGESEMYRTDVADPIKPVKSIEDIPYLEHPIWPA